MENSESQGQMSNATSKERKSMSPNQDIQDDREEQGSSIEDAIGQDSSDTNAGSGDSIGDYPWLCKTCAKIMITPAIELEEHPYFQDVYTFEEGWDAGCQICRSLRQLLAYRTRFAPPVDYIWEYYDAFPTKWRWEGIGSDPDAVDTVAACRISVCFINRAPENWWDPLVNLYRNNSPAILRSFQRQGRDEQVELTRGWLRQCEASCEEKCGNQSEYVPTHLLDLITFEPASDLKLVETRYAPASQDFSRYMTLSHCWGDPNKRPLRLLRTNKASLERHIAFTDLSKSFQDAVDLTRKLGCRYFWIDSLCIIQNDKADWERESRTMHQIYQSSTLNIVANAASDGSQGLYIDDELAGRTIASTVKLSWKGLSDPYYTCTDSRWFRPLTHAPAAQRAWIVQERLLARRAIHFADTQLFWECRNGPRRNEIWPQGYPSSTVHNTYFSERYTNMGFVEVGLLHTSRDILAGHTERWDNVVELYSSARLTMTTDRHIAMAGIVQEIKRLQPSLKDDYFAGIWRSLLPGALYWSAAHKCHRHKVREPTWSWTSMEGPVSVREHDPMVDVASLTSIDIDWKADPQDLGVAGIRIPLVIEGPFACGTSRPDSDPFADKRIQELESLAYQPSSDDVLFHQLGPEIHQKLVFVDDDEAGVVPGSACRVLFILILAQESPSEDSVRPNLVKGICLECIDESLSVFRRMGSVSIEWNKGLWLDLEVLLNKMEHRRITLL